MNSMLPLIGLLLHAWTLERDIDIQSCRTVTFKREDLQRGLEPDNCYYVANEARVRSKTELDLTLDPPPDLAIEIDLGGGRMRKLAIYAAFGVPEVWWFDGRTPARVRPGPKRTISAARRPA